MVLGQWNFHAHWILSTEMYYQGKKRRVTCLKIKTMHRKYRLGHNFGAWFIFSKSPMDIFSQKYGAKKFCMGHFPSLQNTFFPSWETKMWCAHRKYCTVDFFWAARIENIASLTFSEPSCILFLPFTYVFSPCSKVSWSKPNEKSPFSKKKKLSSIFFS